MVDIESVAIEKPDDVNFIFGQSHFIKTIEDIHEAMVASAPGIKFGAAFCEASGKCLVRWTGNDPNMMELAQKNALRIGAGHTFIIFMREAYPLNVLNAIKGLNVVCRIFCATSNPTEVLIVENGRGRGVIGVIDGERPKGVEDAEEQRWRLQLLRKIGYKLGPV